MGKDNGLVTNLVGRKIIVYGTDMQKYKIQSIADRVKIKKFVIEAFESTYPIDSTLIDKVPLVYISSMTRSEIYLTEHGVKKFEEYFPINRVSTQKADEMPQDILTHENYSMGH